MILHNRTDYGWSSILIVMNVVAFILCLYAIFSPSMPNEHGNTIFFILNGDLMTLVCLFVPVDRFGFRLFFYYYSSFYFCFWYFACNVCSHLVFVHFPLSEVCSLTVC